MLKFRFFKQFVLLLVIAGLLAVGSDSVYSEDHTYKLATKERFEKIQKVCAKAVKELLNRADIPNLRECISLLNSFVVSYSSSPLTEKIKNELPIVPIVDWFDEVIPLSEGEYAIGGRVNGEPVEVVIRPDATRARISQELIANLNLERGLKIRIEDESVDKEFFTTRINDLQINSLNFINIVALIDSALEVDQLVIGSDVLRGLVVEDSGESLTLSGGIIHEGSEMELGISRPIIANLLDQLISDLLASFEKRMSKMNRTLQLASGIENVDEYGVKLGLLDDVKLEVKKIANEYPEILDSQRSKIDTFLNKAQRLIDGTTKKREKYARKLCKQVTQAGLLIARADDLDMLIERLERAYEVLGRLEDNFRGTEVEKNLKTSRNYCGFSSARIGLELDTASQYLEAVACVEEGLLTLDYERRTGAYECALQIIKDIEAQSEDSTLASRVESGSEMNTLSKDKLKELIEIEDEAQDGLANTEELRQKAMGEDRLPRRYDILNQALEELEAVRRLGAAVDPELLGQNLQEIRSELIGLEQTMPIEPSLVDLEGGCFNMGSIKGDADAAVDEELHEVCIEGFQIGIFEVTFDEFDRYSNLQNKQLIDDRGWGRETKPVINVSYMEAIDYAKWLSLQTGHNYRLPTESEWEYAARGGQETIFPWGNRVGRNKANCRNCRSAWGGKETTPVGSFEPNGYGIHDMAGNVAERTCSLYRASYDGSEKSCQPLDAAGDRVVRGGSWKSHSRNIRISYRYAAKEIDKKSRFRGFRLVQEHE